MILQALHINFQNLHLQLHHSFSLIEKFTTLTDLTTLLYHIWLVYLTFSFERSASISANISLCSRCTCKNLIKMLYYSIIPVLHCALWASYANFKDNLFHSYPHFHFCND